MKFIILVSLLITCVYGATERCRKTPVPQWYGYMHESNHESMSQREPTLRRARLYYDSTNQRINITETELFEPGDRTSRFSELQLHDASPPMGYRLDLTTGKCSSRPLNESFVPFGVPSEAKFGNIDYLGAELPGLGLKVDSFHEKFENDGGSYFGFWAPASNLETAGCVPIIETYRDRQAPVPQRNNIHITFEDIVPVSAENPFPADTFIVPAACRGRQ